MATQASAYPRLSPSGLRVVAGEKRLIVDRTIDVGPGIGGQWRDESSVLYARQPDGQPGPPDGALMLWREGHLPTLVREQGFNAFVVAGERWIGWRAGEGLIWYDDVPWRGWHSPALSETRWAAILDIHPSKVLFAGRGDGRDGVRVAPSVERQVDGIFARDPVLRGDLLTWVEEDQRTHEMSVWGQDGHNGPIENITIPGNIRQGYVVPVEIFGERWALSHDDARVYLYPWDDPAHGHVVAYAPAHRPDARQKPDQIVRCVWDAEHDVLGEKLIDVRTEPRVDLRPQAEPVPERLPDGTEIDLLPFIVGDVSTWPRDGSHYLHQTWDGRNLHLLKFGPMAEGSTFGDNWERWVLDGDQFYIREDRSQSGAGCYSIHPGYWFKRHMRVGESIDCSDAVLQRYDPKTCQVIDQHPLPYRLKLAEAWTNVVIGGTLGVRDIVVCDSDPGGLNDTIERYWFARGAGLYQWRVTEQRDPSKTHTTSFTERGGPALTPTQGCWRRELVPWPPSPPKPPDPKPTDPPTPDPTPEPAMSEVSLQTFNRSNWIVAEDGGGQEGETAHGRPTGLARADRAAPGAWETFTFMRGADGRVGFRAPNGGWLSAQPDGTLVFNRHRSDDWQPDAWEGFRVEGGLEGGVSLVTDHGTRVRAVNAGGGELRHDVREVAGIDETFFPSVPLTGGGTGGGHVGGGHVDPGPGGTLTRLRVSGRVFANDAGPFDYRELSAFGAYARWLQGRQGQLEQLASISRAHKVTSWRVILTLSGDFWHRIGTPCGPSIGGFYEHLLPFTRWCASQGLYVRYCLIGGIEEFGGNPVDRRDDFRSEVRERAYDYVGRVVTALAGEPNLLWNVANEWNQIGLRDSFDRVVEMGRIVKSIAPHHLLNLSETNGPIADDPMWARDPADFVDAHLDRRTGIGGFEWVKRSSESPVVDNGRMPFLSGEPINFGTPAPGRPDDAEMSPAVAFCYGATSRTKRYLTNFHYHGGLTADVPDGATQACLDGWRRGLDAIPLGFPGGWCNGHHNCSPWDIDNFPRQGDNEDAHGGPIRIFGLSGSEGYIGVSVRERSGRRPLERRPVQEVDRVEWGGYASAVYRA